MSEESNIQKSESPFNWISIVIFFIFLATLFRHQFIKSVLEWKFREVERHELNIIDETTPQVVSTDGKFSTIVSGDIAMPIINYEIDVGIGMRKEQGDEGD